MPQYAPYGNAIYGITAYGSPPAAYVQTTMSVSPIPTSGTPSTGLYDSLFISWVLPGGNWNQMILARSSFSVPASPFAIDGVQLLNQTGQFNTSFTDTGLQTGRFYYYSLFVFDTDVNEWLLAASAQGLCLTDYGFENFFVAWTPDWYMEQDQLLVPANPLLRFFNLIGFEMNWVRSEIETLFTLNSPEYISGAMLPFLGGNVGIGYEPALGMGLSRNLVSQAVELYKTKGTLTGVQGAASAYSGYGCTLTLGPNLEIQLDDATADRSIGHWTAYNSTTTISQTAASAVYGGTLPQHVNYLPIQGNAGLSTGLLTTVGANGYLPPNNEDFFLLSANSAWSWAQQTQNSSIPSPRLGYAMAYNPNTGQTVLFGGNSNSGYLNDTWVFNGTYWTQVFSSSNPSVREYSAMAFDPVSGNLILFGGGNLTNDLNDTWSWNGTSWTQLSPATSPGKRLGHGMAQYASTGIVLFGGETIGGTFAQETWQWNGTTWAQLSPALQPGGRAHHCMAYDSFEQATPAGTGVVLLFGGEDNAHPLLDDTWLWNGTTWINVVAEGGSVPVRAWASMAYDAANDTVVLFGGEGNAGNLNDTWVWGGTAWTQRNAAGGLVNSPLARYASGMAYDAKGQLVLFGGYTTLNALTNDTWIWNGTTWLLSDGTQTPLPRQDAAIAYDAGTSTVVLFGGYNPAWVINGGYLNSTWTWNGTTWTQVFTATTFATVPPSPRYAAAMTYTTGNNVILYGGNQVVGGVTSPANDTWQWNGTSWSQLTTTGGVPALAYPSMVYDASVSRIVLFGGTGNSGATNQTWYFNTGTNTWTQQAPVTSPPVRTQSQMVYTTGGISVLFGGDGSSGALADTWEWNSGTGNWVSISSTLNPPARFSACMAYDTALTRTILFTGIGTGGTNLTDSWQFNAGQWSALNFGTPNPYPRSDAAAVYYSPSQSILLFGGLLGSQLGDTWVASFVGGGIYISECDPTNATVLGIPIVNISQISNSYMVTTVQPLGWWRMNEKIPSPVKNYGSVTNNTNGVLYGTGTLIGQPGAVPTDTAYTFNGHSYVFVPENEFYQFGSNQSFFFGGFFNTTSSAAGLTIVAKGFISNAAGYEVYISGGYLTAQLSDGTHFPSVVGPSVADGKWHFVTCTVNRTTQVLSMYLDGVLLGTSSTAALGSVTSAPTGLGIGGAPDGAVGLGLFIGSLQEVFVGSGVLTASQVKTLYSSLLNQTSQPIIPTAAQYVLSGYFQPIPAAVTLESFFAQLDWYSSNGSLISSTAGAPVTEIAGSWVRPYVAATPPAGAAYIGRTFKTVSTAMSGDFHLFDAVQLEVNTQATPGPTVWTPPRDLWLNLFPYARNLVVNGQGTLGTQGFDAASSGSTITAVSTGPSTTPVWPANVSAGFSVTTHLNAWIFETTFSGPSILPVNPGQAYSAAIWVLYPSALGYNTNNFFDVAINWYANTSSSSFISTTNGSSISGVTIGQAAGTWLQAVCLDVVAPPTAQYAQIQAVGGSSAGATIYVAAPCFGPGTNTTYFDGLFSPSPDYAFEGTPNLSPTAWYPNVLTRLDRLIEVMPEYTPIGSTFSIYTHANAWANAGLH